MKRPIPPPHGALAVLPPELYERWYRLLHPEPEAAGEVAPAVAAPRDRGRRR